MIRLPAAYRSVAQMRVEYPYLAVHVGVERDLVVDVESLPELVRRGKIHFYGLSRKARERLAVALVGAYEVALALGGLLVAEELAQAGAV